MSETLTTSDGMATQSVGAEAANTFLPVQAESLPMKPMASRMHRMDS
jgi:hypothetical protein